MASSEGTPLAIPSPAASPRHVYTADVPDSAALDAVVEQHLTSLSLDDKLGQLIVFQTRATAYSGNVVAMVEGMRAGGMIVYGRNMVSEDQIRAFVAQMQAHASTPMLIGVDEEGGTVNRLAALYAPRPSARALAATGDPRRAYDAAALAAQEMRGLGINLDFAPVVDVALSEDAFEESRLFGNTLATVVTYAGQFLAGLQEHGIIGSLKHWPGIGSATLDPHQTLPTLDRARAQLESVEFAAFRGLLPWRPGMIMVTHVIVPEIDSVLPATLSPTLVTDVLRGELNYQGVVVTDDLNMKGITLRYTVPQAAVMAIEAGNDILLGISGARIMRQTLAALRAAVQRGRLSTQRIDESVRRILALKARFGLIEDVSQPVSGEDGQ